MITISQRNKLLLLLEEYRDAWDDYIQATVKNSENKFHLGHKVTNKEEELREYIRGLA